MTDDQKSGQESEGTGKSSTQKSDTISMSAYKTIQKDLQKAKDELKELKARAREGQSVEAQLNEVQTELEERNRELNTLRLKAIAPKELHDYIDKQLDKGRVLDEDDIQDLVDRLPKNVSEEGKPNGKTTEEKGKESQKETSGVRNSGPIVPDSDEALDDYLKKTNVKDALGL